MFLSVWILLPINLNSRQASSVLRNPIKQTNKLQQNASIKLTHSQWVSFTVRPCYLFRTLDVQSYTYAVYNHMLYGQLCLKIKVLSLSLLYTVGFLYYDSLGIWEKNQYIQTINIPSIDSFDLLMGGKLKLYLNKVVY